MALKTSHGYETPSSKLLLRLTVVISDLLCTCMLCPSPYIGSANSHRCLLPCRLPPGVRAVRCSAVPPPRAAAGVPAGDGAQPSSHYHGSRPFSVQWHQPGPRGEWKRERHRFAGPSHFLSNQTSYQALSVACIARGYRLAGSMLFCTALSHKQMSLYLAPAFFAHLLGQCLQQRGWGRKVR